MSVYTHTNPCTRLGKYRLSPCVKPWPPTLGDHLGSPLFRSFLVTRPPSKAVSRRIGVLYYHSFQLHN